MSLKSLESPGVFFSETGRLQAKKKDFQLRPQQKEMAEAVMKAFKQGGILFAEGGTGTGKSFAYLYPAILQSLVEDTRVVIATQTIALQEQVFLKDLPFLEKVMGISLQKAIAKGRGNYLCLRKVSAREQDKDLPEEELQFQQKVLDWVNETQQGDKEELSLTFSERPMWNRVMANGEDCYGPACSFFRDCFYYKQKRKVESSNLIITNSSLLIRDMKTNNKILPEYDYLIIDEGHNFPDEFINQYTDVFDSRKSIQQLEQILRNKGSILGKLERNFLDNIFFKDMAVYIRNLREDIQETVGLVRKAGGLIAVDDAFAYQEKRIRPENREAGSFPLLLNALDLLLKQYEKILEWITKIYQVLEEQEIYGDLISEIAVLGNQVTEKKVIIRYFVEPDFEKYVYWTKGGAMYVAPLQVSQLIQSLLCRQKKSIIVTSATLSVGQKFDFILQSFGLRKEEATCLQMPSPFNFQEQARLHLVGEEKNSEELLSFLDTLLQGFYGGSLILFTSHDMLKKAFYYLSARNPHRSILADGISGSRRHVLKEFRRAKDGVLLGADSFWEGIDLEGDTLQNLVMTKLPFLPPNRPIVEAALENITRAGGNQFYDYSVPKAVIRFRQGFGRLIRSEKDHGDFYILDHRLLEKSYGKIFLNSLPQMERQVIN